MPKRNFLEAASAYILFRDLHPKHEKLPYVIWMIAESYYEQLPSTFDRDLSPGKEAIKYYREIVTNYPKSEYRKRAVEKLEETVNLFRKKDRYIADFYFKTGVYDSAKYRYVDIADNYKDEALVRYSRVRAIKSALLAEEFSDCIRLSEKYLVFASEKDRPEMMGLSKECQEKLGQELVKR